MKLGDIVWHPDGSIGEVITSEVDKGKIGVHWVHGERQTHGGYRVENPSELVRLVPETDNTRRMEEFRPGQFRMVKP